MAFGVVVLVSGTGTLLQALLEAAAGPDAPFEVRGVVSDRAGVAALDRAVAAGVPTVVHRLARGSDRALWDAALTETVGAFDPGLVVSAGFMKLVGATFLARFGGRFVNTHPALLPAFPGMHGPRDALAYGVKITGATVFMVDEGVDSGAILAQAAVPVLDRDTVVSLHERIKVVERELLLDVVRDFATRAEPDVTDPGPAVTDPAVPDPAQTDPAQTDPAQTDPALPDPAQPDPAHTVRPAGTR